MAFKLITVLCATFAFAHAGLLAAPAAYSAANEVSQVYNSYGAIQQPLIGHAAPVLAAPAIAKIAAPVIAAPASQIYAAPAQQVYAAPAVAAVKSYATPAPIYSAPIAKIAYSPANEVSRVYSSIGAIQQQPIIAQAAPVLAAKYASPVIAAPAPRVYASQSYAAPAIASIRSYATGPAPLIAAPAPQVYAGPAVAAIKSYAAPAPIYQAPIAKVAYSPASEVSQTYSSIAAPQYAYSAHAPVAISAPAIGSSQQSTIRSLGGTVSTYSKAVDTAFSSVRKSDTRISNNVFTPALATKTIAYQQPAIIEQKSYPATVVSHVTFDGLGAHYAW